MFTIGEKATVVGVAELRTEISHILREIEDHDVVLTKRNKPVGVILNYEEYQKIRIALEEMEDGALGMIAKKRSSRKGKKTITLEEAEKRVGLR